MTDPTFWETARLSIGAFLTSPGAGLIGLLGAAWLTFVGVGRRISGDRQLAQEARGAEREQDSETVSDIEPEAPRVNVTKKAAARSTSAALRVSRSASAGQFGAEKSSAASTVAACPA